LRWILSKDKDNITYVNKKNLRLNYMAKGGHKREVNVDKCSLPRV
jgi:hypothetical protein